MKTYKIKNNTILNSSYKILNIEELKIMHIPSVHRMYSSLSQESKRFSILAFSALNRLAFYGF